MRVNQHLVLHNVNYYDWSSWKHLLEWLLPTQTITRSRSTIGDVNIIIFGFVMRLCSIALSETVYRILKSVEEINKISLIKVIHITPVLRCFFITVSTALSSVWNKRVLSCSLSDDISDFVVCLCTGSLFHSLEPAMENALSPY